MVCTSVCQSVTTIRPAKTAEPIEMLFGVWTHMGQTNHVLDKSPHISSMERGSFEGGKEQSIVICRSSLP